MGQHLSIFSYLLIESLIIIKSCEIFLIVLSKFKLNTKYIIHTYLKIFSKLNN